MKKINLLIAIMSMMTFACSQSSEPDTLPDSASDNQAPDLNVVSASNPTVRFVPIAKVNSNNSVKLLIDNLKGTFEDGGKIEYFILRKGDAKFNFVRLGKDANGKTRSEAFQVSSHNGQLRLKIIDELVWFVSCFGSCFGCMPNSEGTKCECDTTMGIDDDGNLTVFDWSGTEVVDWNLDGSGVPVDNCTFGSGGGGLYATQVIN